jgi:hypothetical protein
MTLRSRNELERGIHIDLQGPEGNAFALLARAEDLAKQLSLDGEAICAEMKEGDYDHLVAVFEKHFGAYVTLYQ